MKPSRGAVIQLVLLTFLASQATSFEFPKDFELCHRSDSDCIAKRANEIIRTHPHGYPEILLPDFEPFRLGDLRISGNPNSPINFNLEMTDVVMHGYSNMTFTKLSGFTKDPNKVKIRTESVNARVTMNGKYKISGRLLVFPITGDGDSNVVMEGLHIKAVMRTTPYKKDGKIHLKTQNYKMQVNADNMKIQMTNLFNGDKVLSENILSIMNEQWKLLWDEMSPRFNQEVADANVKMFDTMFENVPYEEMFLPD